MDLETKANFVDADICSEALIRIAADIVSAYVKHNSLPAADLPGLVCRTYETLFNLTLPQIPAVPPTTEIVPAVPINASITDDHLVCLVTGLKFKSLKRHLAKLGMTPESYRACFDLPQSYPMVAPAYSRARSGLAKQTGLGVKRQATVVASKTVAKPGLAAKPARPAPGKRKAA